MKKLLRRALAGLTICMLLAGIAPVSFAEEDQEQILEEVIEQEIEEETETERVKIFYPSTATGKARLSAQTLP